MKTNEQILELVTRLGAATDEIARDFSSIRQELVNGSVSLEVIALFDAGVKRLEAMGRDEANPIPDSPATGDVNGGGTETGEATTGNGTEGNTADDTAGGTPADSGTAQSQA